MTQSDTLITLERGACFGACPIYRVTIAGDGTISYHGDGHVAVTGQQIDHIAPEQVAQLVAYMQARDYSALADRYDAFDMTDMPTYKTSLVVGGISKSVEHYAGDLQAPFVLTQIENQIDLVANTLRWTEKSPPTSLKLFGSFSVRGANMPVSLPQGSQMRLTVQDISVADTASVVIAEREYAGLSQVPALYHLSVPVDALSVSGTYTLSAEIRDAHGDLRYITDTVFPVFTANLPNSAEIELVPIP